jgi:hypothetical protein
MLVEKRGFGKGGWMLGLARAVDGFDPLVWGMLLFGGWWMVELLEGPINVVGHGDVHIAFRVVPIKDEAAVEGAGPVDGELVVGFDDVN